MTRDGENRRNGKQVKYSFTAKMGVKMRNYLISLAITNTNKYCYTYYGSLYSVRMLMYDTLGTNNSQQKEACKQRRTPVKGFPEKGSLLLTTPIEGSTTKSCSTVLPYRSPWASWKGASFLYSLQPLLLSQLMGGTHCSDYSQKYPPGRSVGRRRQRNTTGRRRPPSWNKETSPSLKWGGSNSKNLSLTNGRDREFPRKLAFVQFWRFFTSITQRSRIYSLVFLKE